MKQINQSLAPLVASFSSSLSVFAIAVKVRGFLNCPPSDSGANDEIPLVHRLAIAYLLLPVVIWLVGWFEWWFGVPFAVLVALGLWQALGPARASLNWQTFCRTLRAALRPATVMLLLIAFAWVMATAAGGVFDVHHPEWHKHRSIFLDLSRSEWPVHLPAWTSDLSVFLPGEADRPGSLLRYYLGYYMVPGLLGKWLGPVVLNWAVPLWTWCGVGLMLLLFTRWFRGWKVPAAAAILILFSGMDAVSEFVFGGWEWLELGFAWNGWPEIRPGRNSLDGIVRKDVWVQFLSNMFGLMWIPQHFIAGGLCALLIVQLRRHERFPCDERPRASDGNILVALHCDRPAATLCSAVSAEWYPLLSALAELAPGAAFGGLAFLLLVKWHGTDRAGLDLEHPLRFLAGRNASLIGIILDGICDIGFAALAIATKVAPRFVIHGFTCNSASRAPFVVWPSQ